MGTGSTWVRGAATVRRGWVVLDERTTSTYSPLDEPDLLREFVAIRSSRDIARYASRFGLLRGARALGPREPLADWWDEIGLVSGALKIQLDAMAAMTDDEGDVARFREDWQATLPAGVPAPASDAELIVEARAAVLAAVNRGLAGAQLEISMEPSQGYALSPRISDLIGFIYFGLAKVLIEEPPLARCLECGAPFAVHDKRQRYCSERHANRARYRRFRDGQRGAAGAPI
jgi:hypothetical protein